DPLSDALARGAVAVILVTTGPTGEALLLNAPADAPLSSKPLALLAPRLAAPVIEAARQGRPATLVLNGKGGSRVAENVVARRVRAGGGAVGLWSHRRVGAGPIGRASAGRASRSGLRSPHGCRAPSPITACSSSAIAGTNMKIWARAMSSRSSARRPTRPISG